MKNKSIIISLFIIMLISGIIVFVDSKINVTALSLADSRLLNNKNTVLEQKVIKEIEVPISQKG